MEQIHQVIADELSVNAEQVAAAVALLDEGATVPFISRYRKEVTGALDDTQLRALEERLAYLRELEQRREVILKTIDEQGKLTPELASKIKAAGTKVLLEDLYLPYKVKRRTKAEIAREAGLEPLADTLYEKPEHDPETEARRYLNKEHKIETSKDALDGARQILMERFSEDAELLEKLRNWLREFAYVSAEVVAGKEGEGAKFRDYFEYREKFSDLPSHRALALFRGRNEGVLTVRVTLKEDLETGQTHPSELMIAEHWGIEDQGRAADKWLLDTVRWTWRVKLSTRLDVDLFGELRERAEASAIEVFSMNLKDLLLAAPAGQKVTMGLDPGLRTGVKLAVVDGTGRVLDHGAIFPTAPQNRMHEAEATVVALCRKHRVNLIAIGNGTASRETDKFIGDVLKRHKDLKVQKIIVNEAGASVYSASEVAAREFPDLDVTIRGAVSIARRLQDPLAELVKIEPKAIGVGQYQHDVSQTRLAKSLDTVVEDCVNSVGVELNTASVPLLARVSGLNQSIAGNIVEFRDRNGAFKSREQLKEVPRLGPKAFEQAAGFLRVAASSHPLDASAVHPESYAVVEEIAARHKRQVSDLIGDSAFLKSLRPEDYVSEQVGLPTIVDIIQELDKPGRDPRPEFKMARFEEGVEKLSDLEPGMLLEGTVTNVTHFGAFVDIGVHQDGLVHISALAEKFVKDPRDVVKVGEIVKVKVMEVDLDRKRISLTMRVGDQPEARGPRAANSNLPKRKQPGRQRDSRPAANGTMAALLQEAFKKRK